MKKYHRVTRSLNASCMMRGFQAKATQKGQWKWATKWPLHSVVNVLIWGQESSTLWYYHTPNESVLEITTRVCGAKQSHTKVSNIGHKSVKIPHCALQHGALWRRYPRLWSGPWKVMMKKVSKKVSLSPWLIYSNLPPKRLHNIPRFGTLLQLSQNCSKIQMWREFESDFRYNFEIPVLKFLGTLGPRNGGLPVAISVTWPSHSDTKQQKLFINSNFEFFVDFYAKLKFFFSIWIFEHNLSFVSLCLTV